MMEKKVLRLILALFTLGLTAVGAAGCKDINNIRLTSCSLVSLSPKGFRSADAVLALGVDNPAMAFKISDLKGEIVRDTGVAATFSAGTVNIEGKKEEIYYLPCTASIDESVSLLELAALATSRDLSGYRMNIECKVETKNGLGRTLHFNDIEISNLVK